MNEWGWLLAGGAAITGAITMFWSYVRSFWSQIASHIIVNCKVQGGLEQAVSMYCWQRYKTSPYGMRNYLGWTMFVRPVKRVQLIAMEIVGTNGKLFWRGWRPIWVKRASRYDKSDIVMQEKNFEAGLTLTFIRGTFNLDQLLIAATNEYNEAQAATDHQTQPRYFVKHVFGTDGKPAAQRDDGLAATENSRAEWSAITSMQNRILQWQPDELGTCRMNHGNAIGQLALSPDAEAMVQEIKRWRTSEEWYKSRGIPWRRGWLLYGPPGTGKTSLVRAVAEDFDLPVFVYHLATLYDNELQTAWQKMQTAVPCIALIEDIDTVFHGRKNAAGGHLTFDCLLNCLDGIERAGGVLLVITTNCLDHLDPALGTPTANHISSRPGRLDRVLEMNLLNEQGRRKLCERILAEWPETWPEVIEAGRNETGAQFQGRCTQKALQLYWEGTI
ncbi:MAG: AAA family ATPase [Pirellulales bacterium]